MWRLSLPARLRRAMQDVRRGDTAKTAADRWGLSTAEVQAEIEKEATDAE